jgi:hypothetical protein
MRVPVSIAAAAVSASLAGCSPRPSYPPIESMVNETVSITAPADTIRALEADLRKTIQERHDDSGAGINLSESGGPPPRTVDANSEILNAAVDDARRKGRALANAVHATLGDVLAVDEVNPADPNPRYGGSGGQGLKGAVLASRVTFNGEGPEIVRVTFALAPHGHGPTTVTVYGVHATRPPETINAATQLMIGINASGDDPLKTVSGWEVVVRDAAHRHGVPDAGIRIGNVNATFAKHAR